MSLVLCFLHLLFKFSISQGLLRPWGHHQILYCQLMASYGEASTLIWIRSSTFPLRFISVEKEFLYQNLIQISKFSSGFESFLSFLVFIHAATTKVLQLMIISTLRSVYSVWCLQPLASHQQDSKLRNSFLSNYTTQDCLIKLETVKEE